mgnify:CR=1 FL=1
MNKSNYVYLDANAVLRYVLEDIEDQHELVKDTIKTEYCVIPLEVITEVAFVLDGVYGVPDRKSVV